MYWCWLLEIKWNRDLEFQTSSYFDHKFLKYIFIVHVLNTVGSSNRSNLLLSSTVLYHRKCNLLDCKKQSHLWKVFRGCGYSFHIECVFPDVRVCKICESTLKEKFDDLGNIANDAVFHHNLKQTVDDKERRKWRRKGNRCRWWWRARGSVRRGCWWKSHKQFVATNSNVATSWHPIQLIEGINCCICAKLFINKYKAKLCTLLKLGYH